jgi:hypothetical protein
LAFSFHWHSRETRQPHIKKSLSVAGLFRFIGTAARRVSHVRRGAVSVAGLFRFIGTAARRVSHISHIGGKDLYRSPNITTRQAFCHYNKTGFLSDPNITTRQAFCQIQLAGINFLRTVTVTSLSRADRDDVQNITTRQAFCHYNKTGFCQIQLAGINFLRTVTVTSLSRADRDDVQNEFDSNSTRHRKIHEFRIGA